MESSRGTDKHVPRSLSYDLTKGIEQSRTVVALWKAAKRERERKDETQRPEKFMPKPATRFKYFRLFFGRYYFFTVLDSVCVCLFWHCRTAFANAEWMDSICRWRQTRTRPCLLRLSRTICSAQLLSLGLNRLTGWLAGRNNSNLLPSSRWVVPGVSQKDGIELWHLLINRGRCKDL